MTTPRVTVPVDMNCPKCGARSGDDWEQCGGRCPMPGSPHYSAAPAPEGGVVERACVDFQRAIDDFEADVADVMAEGSERADLWDREITVNIDALKTVMSAALATREEASAEVGELVADLTVLSTCDDMEVSHSGGDTNVGDVARRCLNRLRAKPPAREDGGDRPIEASWTDGVTHAYVNLSAALSAERQAWRQKLGLRIASVRYLDVEVPPAREDAQPVGWKHTDKCWGKTSYSDEMAHCYCQKEQEKEASPQPVGWLRPDTLKGLMDADESVVGIQSLVAAHETKHNTVAVYTHPAPDALRVAVESLEWAIAEIKGDTRYDNEDHREAALEKAQSTLAALQAEQKGGA